MSRFVVSCCAAAVLLGSTAACSESHQLPSQRRGDLTGSGSITTAFRSDPPLLIPWRKVGDITLGESKMRVERRYAKGGHRYHVLIQGSGIIQGYYRLHNSRVYVTFQDGRVNELDFSTRYYRTTDGFGVGSRIPLGRCYRTPTNPCEHRWHGFVWNAWRKETPCHCWFKATKPLKPAFAIFVRDGRVSQIYLAQKFVD